MITKYELDDRWKQVSTTKGTIQNISIDNILVSEKKDSDYGFVLKPLSALSFSGSLYAKSQNPRVNTQVVIADFINSSNGVSEQDIANIQAIAINASKSAEEAQQAASNANAAVDRINNKTIMATADGINFKLNKNNGLSVSATKEGE